MNTEREITEYRTKFDNLFLNSINITGIPISGKTFYNPRQFIDIKTTDRKIYRPKNYVTIGTVTNINRNFSTNSEEIKIDKKKLTRIKNLLTKPVYKNPFDYLSLKRKKCTIQYLIQKISKKENQVNFSENNLCKKNFPLIKFITNRKSFNNSKKLMVDLMTAEYGDLTKEQYNTIKYSEYKRTNILKIKKKKTIKKRPNSFQNALIKKMRNYEFGRTVNLSCHNTNKNNFDILTTMFNRNFFLDDKGQKNQNLNNGKICEILRDISHLKVNHKIMPLDIRMKTI